MALLTTQQITGAGLSPTFGAVSASDTANSDTDLFLFVKNAGGSADVVTVVDNGVTPAGSPGTPATVSVPATTGQVMIPLPQARASASGIITVTHSFTTSVTCALVRGA